MKNNEPKSNEPKKNEPEMLIITICFGLLVLSILSSFFTSWGMEIGGIFYALIALVGVITCARKKTFMAVDSLVEAYPEGLKNIVHKVKDILMLLVFTILFVLGILGVKAQIAAPAYTENLGFPLIILYAIPILVYPISIFYYGKAMLKDRKEDK